jgi:hypothetical protein
MAYSKYASRFFNLEHGSLGCRSNLGFSCFVAYLGHGSVPTVGRLSTIFENKRHFWI